MKTEQEKMLENVINQKSEKSSKKTAAKNTNMLGAAFMIFIFPIISVFIGIFLGGYIGKSVDVSIKTSQIAGGIIAFILAVVIIRLFDRHSVLDKDAERIYWRDL